MSDDLKDLENKIAAFKASEKKTDEAAEERQRAQMSAGMQAGTEFMSYVIGGGVVGFFFDKLTGTLPLFLIVFMFAGFGYGIFRAAKVMK